MICTTFHPFPNLPCELRLLIWEAACLEWCSRRGIHYVTGARYTTISPMSYNWDESKPRNKSMYLWHAGLWTACRESREVVFKHWGKQPRPDNWWDMWECCSAEEANLFIDHIWPQDDEPKARMMSSRVDHEHWRQIVNAERDIFCITAEDWDSLTQECQKSDNWDWDFKMAVEFDPSWNEPFEDQYYGSPVENLSGSLNFVIQLLYRIVSKEHDLKTRIIDRQAKWMAQYSSIGSTFYDCDEEFIEIPLEYGRMQSARLVAGSGLLYFFNNLEYHYYSDLQEIYCRRQGLSLDYETDQEERNRFDLGDYFSILVLWRNQVDYVQDWSDIRHHQRSTGLYKV